MTQLPRAMSSPELSLIRSDGQSSELFLWCDVPPSVYTARINQTFSSLDSVTQIVYDTGSGTLANVLPGMSVLIGTSAGAYDIGFARVRKTPTSTILYIGEESELVLADNLYLTIVDQFLIWPRHPALDANNVEYMDLDVAYTDQHTKPNPVPCIGPRFIPVWLTGATVVVSWDASLSWILDGTVLSYSWSFPGASATSGLTTATPTSTYNTTGRYRASCVVTSTNGKSTTAYAWVRAFSKSDMPITQFDLKDCSGSWQRGGWQTKVTMWAEADFSHVIERSPCVLFAIDHYLTSNTSISPVAGRENIITEGWINAESMVEDPDGASLDFTFETANAWLDKIASFPVGIQNQTAAADAWTNWQNLTVDESLYHLLFWQATVIPAMDVFPTNDTRISPEQSVPGEMFIWQQITYLITNTILARAINDRYGRLFAEIDTDLLPVASRSTIPTVLTLTYSDWRDQAKLARYIVSPTSRVASSGVAQAFGVEAASYFSLAPGHVFQRYGNSIKQDRLLLSDQITANVLAALIVGRDNHLYDFTFDLGGNNRMVDIAPRQYVGVNVVAGDTPRGITFSGNMLAREIQISLVEGNFLQISWQGENETFPGNYTNGDIPNGAGGFNGISTFPPFKMPPFPPFPPVVYPTPDAANIKTIVLSVGGALYYTKDFSPTSHWFSWSGGLPVTRQMLQFDVSLISGRGFACYSPQAQRVTPTWAQGLYTSPGLGQPWTVFFTLAQAFAAIHVSGGQDNAFFPGLAVNRNASNEIACIISETFDGTSAGLRSQFFHGSSGGLSGGGVAVHGIGTGFATMMAYGSDKWIAASPTGYFYRLSRSAGIELESAAGLAQFLTKSSLDGKNAIAWTSTIYTTPDLGTTFNALTSPSYPDTSMFAWREACATDPSGQYIMYCPNLSIAPQKSSDGGTTWSALGTPAIVVDCFWNLGDPMHWVVQGGVGVWYTPDFGASWIDYTGDLRSILGIGWVGQSIRSLG